MTEIDDGGIRQAIAAELMKISTLIPPEGFRLVVDSIYADLHSYREQIGALGSEDIPGWQASLHRVIGLARQFHLDALKQSAETAQDAFHANGDVKVKDLLLAIDRTEAALKEIQSETPATKK
jgi:hypothetical protein